MTITLVRRQCLPSALPMIRALGWMGDDAFRSSVLDFMHAACACSAVEPHVCLFASLPGFPFFSE